MQNKEYFNKEYIANRDKWLCADAWGEESGVVKGLVEQRSPAPFILQLVNSTPFPNTATSDVDIGDSFTNRMLTNFGQASNITTTSTVSGVTYREWLASSEEHPFIVGKTMIISTTAGQLEQPIAVTHRNAAGKRQDFIISSTLDPNQSQTDRVVDETEYIFDGMTRLRINEVAAGATVSIRIYPKIVYSATQIIAGRPADEIFKAPDLIRTAKVSWVM